MGALQAGIGYYEGRTTPQVTKLTPEQQQEIMKFITELRKTTEQLKMETVESFAQIANVQATAEARVIAAVVEARAQGEDSKAQVISELGNIASTTLREMYNPNPNIQKRLSDPHQKLVQQVTSTARNIGEGAKEGTLTPEQLVDSYLANITTAGPRDSGNMALADMRNIYNDAMLQSQGAIERGHIGVGARTMALDGIAQGLEEAANGLGLDSASVKDAFLKREGDFRNLIMINPSPLDEKVAADQQKENARRIREITNQLSEYGVNLGPLEYYKNALSTEELAQVLSGGPSGLLEELKDDKVAPETAQFIADLQQQLEDSVNAKDAFQRGIAAYNKIPGANKLREALDLEDDLRFASYMNRNPDAFNKALRGINAKADEANRSANDLKAAEVRGLVAQAIMVGDEDMASVRDLNIRQLNKARRLANRPGRMRRILGRQARKAERDLAGLIAQTRIETAEELGEEITQELEQAPTPTPSTRTEERRQETGRPGGSGAQAAAQEQDSGVVPELDQESQQTEEELAAQEQARQDALDQAERDRITGAERAKLEQEAANQLKNEQARIASQFDEEDKVMIGQNPLNRFVAAYQNLGFPTQVIDSSSNPIIPGPGGTLSKYRAVVDTGQGQIFLDDVGTAVANFSSVTPLTTKDLPDPPRSRATSQPAVPEVDEASRQQLPDIDFQDTSRVETPTSPTPASATGASAAQTTFGTKVRTPEVETTENQPTDTPAGEPPAEGPSLGGQQNAEGRNREEDEAKLRKPKRNRNSMLAMKFSDTPVNYG